MSSRVIVILVMYSVRWILFLNNEYLLYNMQTTNKVIPDSKEPRIDID